MEGEIEDVSASAADVMKAKDSHGLALVADEYGPLRGRAFVLEEDRRSSVIVLLAERPREQKVYTGRILRLGPPAFLGAWAGSPLYPWDCAPGDRVLFQPSQWLDEMRTLALFGVRGRVWVVAQSELLGVLE